jgi:hypothetical protein
MDTPERLSQTKRDFASGKMGRLDGILFNGGKLVAASA